MKAKGPFRGHSRIMAIFPSNFRYDPTPPAKRSAQRPITLTKMFELRGQIRRFAGLGG